MDRPLIPARPGLSLILAVTAGVNLLPFLALTVFSLSGGGSPLLIGSDGAQQLGNTVLLVLCVGLGVALLGTAIGWLTASCRFPGQRLLTLAQLLPLATPAYLQAAVLLDLGGRSGLHLHGLGWCIAVLTLANVPYVVLLSRDSFRLSGRRQLEAARSLGLGPWRSFLRVSLPMAIPAIAAGVALTGMEVINEFGAVELLAVPTLSTGLLERWQGQEDPQGAVGLALLALIVVGLLVVAERWQRRRSRRWDMGGPTDSMGGWQLQGWRALLAQLICAIPPLVSLGLPLVWLLRSLDQLRAESLTELLQLSSHSLCLALIGAACATAMALTFAVGNRWSPPGVLKKVMFGASLGYAVPGTVLAVALLLLLAPLGVPPLLLLMFGYGNRFIAVAKGSLDAGLERLPPSVEEAATSLGNAWPGVLKRIHLPLLRSPLLLGGLLVFVDTVKELPLTFALRPFDFDTLAVRVFQYAGDERLGAAIAPALLIMGLGLAATLLLVPRLGAGSAAAASPPAG
ncbi:MAG: iron ABC transporter permease [Synechococcus sp.]|nr:iron ABC transporter permease [Synechococcus sp.]